MRMRITILGTGTLAEALGRRWAHTGHEITVVGRSVEKARQLAQRLGAGARAMPLAEIAAVPADGNFGTHAEAADTAPAAGDAGTAGTAGAAGWSAAATDSRSAVGADSHSAAASDSRPVTDAGSHSAAGAGSEANLGTAAWAGAEAVLLAVAYTGVEEVLRAVGAPGGALSGLTLIDATNAIDHGVGVLRVPPGTSHAQRVADLAPGARVVKAFHLFPSEQWAAAPSADTGTTDLPPSVTICGDDAAALRTTEQLVRDVGAEPVVLGGLDRARQLEEAAGFVISLAFAGVDPSRAVPAMPTQ